MVVIQIIKLTDTEEIIVPTHRLDILAKIFGRFFKHIGTRELFDGAWEFQVNGHFFCQLHPHKGKRLRDTIHSTKCAFLSRASVLLEFLGFS